MPPERLHWAHLYDEVVTTGLCTGCAGCIVACPYDVLGYDSSGGRYRPFHVEADGGAAGCTHGERGCTLCARSCPRFRSWEPEVDTFLFGRPRDESELSGIAREVVLLRATDPQLRANGQDGGAVSAMLVWALEHGIADAALVSGTAGPGTGTTAGPGTGASAGSGPGAGWQAVPVVVRDRDGVLATSGSRYTYSANTLAAAEAVAAGAERLALVGMSCMASVPATMAARRAGKVARRFALTIGLLCSKTFDDRIFDELFAARYGLERASIVKMNIKGVIQLWTSDGGYHEVPLKEAHAWTREGCTTCPDFAAEHADVSAGGIGAFPDWTLTLVRTERGAELVGAMREAGALEARPVADDPGVLALLGRLSRASRRRWPAGADPAPRRIPVTAS